MATASLCERLFGLFLYVCWLYNTFGIISNCCRCVFISSQHTHDSSWRLLTTAGTLYTYLDVDSAAARHLKQTDVMAMGLIKNLIINNNDIRQYKMHNNKAREWIGKYEQGFYLYFIRSRGTGTQSHTDSMRIYRVLFRWAISTGWEGAPPPGAPMVSTLTSSWREPAHTPPADRTHATQMSRLFPCENVSWH